MNKIVGKRINPDSGVVEYHVDWKPSHGKKRWPKTWEPLENLVGAEDEVENFNKSTEKTKQPSKKLKTK